MPDPAAFSPPRESYDVVILGAGAAGMAAACVAAAEKLRVLVVEKSSQVGGTTALSGGMVWLPANRKTGEIGPPDTVEAAQRYLAACIPGAEADPMLQSFLSHADEALGYLEDRTDVKLRPVRYPDYYPDRAGATAGGRVLEPLPFDAGALGRHFALLAPPLPEFTLFGGMMISRADIPHLRRIGRSLRSTWRVATLLLRHAGQRLRAPRGTTLYLGNALAGRLFLSCIRLGVDFALGSTASVEEGERLPRRVALTGPDGRRHSVLAERAIVLATGGFSHDRALRSRLFPAGAGEVSAASPLAEGDGVRFGLGLGGILPDTNVSAAYWVPGSRFTRADGSAAVFPHTVTDRAKPGMIALDQTGRRFVNEAVSYHEFVLAMLRAGNAANPCFLICDSRALWKYGLGRIKPFQLRLRESIAGGYLVRAGSIPDLARQLGIDVARTEETLAAYNRDAAQGLDPLFGRGGDAYQRHLGDADHAPNPCVAPITAPPFYAVRLHPADLGTAAGLATDGNGRVLDAQARPIPGLYACGNDMNSVMRGAYPGPGITLGPALTFGYLAARHIAGGR